MSKAADMDTLLKKKAFISDMDGVLYHGNKLLPGVLQFVEWLKAEKDFLFLTNDSTRTPRELSEKLFRLGVDVDEKHFFTSPMATALYLAQQKPGGSAFVIGEPGLISALYDVGFSMNDSSPDYVVLGRTSHYRYQVIEQAIRLVDKGAHLIITNPDAFYPTEGGKSPSTGAMAAPIEIATGKKAYYVGKPNPLMMRLALDQVGCEAKDGVMIGDRMDTDILVGIEAQLTTVMVLSGAMTRDDIEDYGFRPHYVLEGVSEIASAVSAEQFKQSK
jgi:NagD protein